jgi:hypothetical protein
LTVPKRANRLFRALREALPLFVLVTRCATLVARELGARLRQLVPKLDVAKPADRLDRLADRVRM